MTFEPEIHASNREQIIGSGKLNSPGRNGQKLMQKAGARESVTSMDISANTGSAIAPQVNN